MKMKKVAVFALAVIIAFGATALSGCSKKNTAPSIQGVQDALQVAAGTQINVLDGVTASDEQDGDITASIVVTSVPALNFVDGAVTPTEQGTYELTYTVADSEGAEAEAYSTLTVTRATSEETLFKQYTFADNYDVDLHGWTFATEDGAEAELLKKNGRLEINVTNAGSAANDVALVYEDFTLKEHTEYTFKLFVSASKADVKIDLENADTPTEGERKVTLNTTLNIAEFYFAGKAAGKEDVVLSLGAIEGQATEGYSIYIEKIEIFSTTGIIEETEIVNEDFSDIGDTSFDWSGGGEDGTDWLMKSDMMLRVAEDQGAAATLTKDSGVFDLNVTAFPGAGKAWALMVIFKIDASDSSENVIEEGKKYKLEIDIKSEQVQKINMPFDGFIDSFDESKRAMWNDFVLEAGSDTTISRTFESSIDLESLYIKFELGLGNDTANTVANRIIFDNLRFCELSMSEDFEESKELTRFTPFDKTTDWDTFNGTDEDFDSGVGTAFTQDGKLVYRIVEVGSADWHNKLFVNKLKLDSFALYRVEFTVKANIDGVAGLFFLNPLGRWDPRLTGELTIGTTEQTFKFSTTSEFVVDTDVELLFQMGGGSNVGKQITLTFSDVKIYKLS